MSGRHLKDIAADGWTLCGHRWRSWARTCPDWPGTVHPSKARRTDCEECRRLWRARLNDLHDSALRRAGLALPQRRA